MKWRAAFLGLAALSLSVAAQSLTTGASARSLVPRHHTLISVGANQSSNWSGYNQGSLALGNKMFNEVSGRWVVPKATAHKAKQAEFSSTWVGIGGGCVDAKCTVGDNTLIQAGTEQDVGTNGKASYSAWWELIPAPSVTISNFRVAPGNVMSVDIKEVMAGANVWTITVKNLSQNETFTQTTPYSSSHLTAEWIEETPVSVGSGGASIGPLPNLSTVHFDLATTNGASAALQASQELQLVANGKTLATPSAPDVDKDGFNDCAYASSCSPPSASRSR